MDLEAMFKIGVNLDENVSKIADRMAQPDAKPVRKPTGGSILTSGTGPQLIVCDNTPSSSRIWQIIKVGLFGSDGHTALTVNGTNPVPSQPAVPASTVAVQNTNLYPVTVVISAGTITAVVVNGITVGTGAGTYTVPSAGAISITYSVAPTWVWSNASALPVIPAVADVYSGYGPDANAPDMQAQVLSGVAVASMTLIGPDRAWSHHNESIYAVVYNAPANQQIVLVAMIDEYHIEDMEAMRI